MRQSTFARQVLTVLADAGWTVSETDLSKTAVSRAAVLRQLAEVDALRVWVTHPQFGDSFLYFVWQGPNATYEDGEEILADFGVKLSEWIDPLYPQ